MICSAEIMQFYANQIYNMEKIVMMASILLAKAEFT